MKKYSALIIDLKKSRSYMTMDRIDIQIYIKDTISILNKIFNNALQLDVVFSAGDEIQGLFDSPQSAYLYFRLFNMLISPVEIRAGIGVGEWNIKIDSAISTEQDGLAYHNARYAINSVEDSLGYSILLYSGGKNDIYINSAINTATILAGSQSEYQNELYLMTELMYPLDVNGVIDQNSILQLNSLIKKKNQMAYYTKWKSNRSIKKYPLMIEFDCELDVTPMDVEGCKESFFVSSGRIRGLSKRLSEILGTSRQNVEKSIKAGNIYQARNSTIVALKLMKEYIGG
ncbi:SatD family protein [Aminipila terrae]|uniref:SatD family (SatD) n=1 Tax=Aminipila terrae TaxID=2697030 RepID=A0A6P1ML93_9FIRM|nr:SatD family protein [Aminipila terrae]QHI73444.1 hypothetical protein Ami3637_14620 [Aminipila terrae]